MVWTVESMDLKLMLYPNLTFGKSSIVQRDKIHGKNNSNGQGKLVQKRHPVPDHAKEQLDMRQS